jgi:hypothetical protein
MNNATIKRNAQIVGNNSKSYNDKHPENPVSLRPVHDAIANVPKLVDTKGFAYPNKKVIGALRRLGFVSARPQLRALYAK